MLTENYSTLSFNVSDVWVFHFLRPRFCSARSIPSSIIEWIFRRSSNAARRKASYVASGK